MSTEQWLKERIAEETDLPIDEISSDQEFTTFNLDSLSILTLAFDLESKLNVKEIDPTVFSEYNTIKKLVSWIENPK
ncbi:acyl carrier protein [Aquimarina pacifica]|uniref:acyl carrier protein n=1 Tax=Aquimarina pacifica TaxID=1296415 RepID=UPI000470A64F|nr:acyl carrier protein [Aquimarina pacifica]